ncbi:MAG TPA: efflux RND transporter periplasmic adaptor subunit [Bryobacteraceae bacterium]|nr:efflux RND transporter periplasmic adaptor subunit [Bryobacteraceae bacterium]
MSTPVKTSESQEPNSPPRKRKAARVIAGLLVLGALLAAGIFPRLSRREQALSVAHAAETHRNKVAVVAVKHSAATSALMLPGNTEAVNVATINARANGYVKRRSVDIGSRVKAGQLLAEIESPEVDQELLQARANVLQSRAAVAQAQANVEQARAGEMQAQANLEEARANQEIAKVTDQRWSALVSKGVLPQQSGDERRSALLARQAGVAAATAALQTARATVASQEASLRAAQAAVQAQEANVRRVEQLQGFQRIVAPFDGVVTERRVERGDLVMAGTNGERPLFAVAQSHTLRIQTNVPQTFAVDLHPGVQAEVTIRELPGRSFRGTVARTANALDATSRTLLTEVQLDNKDGSLLPGMYAQVKYDVPQQRPAFLIPSDALIVDAQGMRVAIVGAGNKIRFSRVEAGRDFGSELEIMSGVSAGDRVIRNPADTLAEGEQVESQQDAPAGAKKQ